MSDDRLLSQALIFFRGEIGEELFLSVCTDGATTLIVRVIVGCISSPEVGIITHISDEQAFMPVGTEIGTVSPRDFPRVFGLVVLDGDVLVRIFRITEDAGVTCRSEQIQCVTGVVYDGSWFQPPQKHTLVRGETTRYLSMP